MKKSIFVIALFSFLVNGFADLRSQELNPGDGVRIIFLDIADEISGDYYIQPDGKLQLPFVGIINTNNKDFYQIKTEVVDRYDSLYRNPELTVLALFRVNILGEVREPGYYFVTEEENLTGILALAGGATGDANLENVYIVRGDREIELDIEAIIERGNTAADFGLKSGDQIYVPRSFWADPARFTWIFSLVALVITVIALFVTK